MSILDDHDDIVSIIRVILENRRVTVIKDDKKETCSWNYEDKSMILSNQVVPLNLRGTKAEPFLMTGAAIHECGHPIYDTRIFEKRVQLIKGSKNPRLMQTAINLVNDAGVNHRMQTEWGETVARNLTFLLTTIGKSMLADIEKELKMTGEVKPIAFLIAVANFNVRLTESKHVLEQLNAPVRKLVVEGIRCIRESIPYTLWEDKSSYYRELYRILTKILACEGKSGANGAADQIPKQMGGQMDVHGSGATKAEAEQQAGDMTGEGDGDADADADGDSDSGTASKEDSDGSSTNVGYDPNAAAPTPTANYDRYLQLVAENQGNIKSILDRLKRATSTAVKQQQFRKAGRIMPGMLTRAATMRNPPTSIYQKTTMQEDKERTRWSVVVDLSGSMSTEQARAALVTLGEVADRYLKSNEFALYVFGSNWMKVKSFYESYNNVRARLGGVYNLGGTYLYEPLKAAIKEFQSFPNGHKNRLIIISDFELGLGDEEDSMEAVKKWLAESPRNQVIPLGLGARSGSAFAKYGVTEIGGIDALPDAFIDLYLKERAA